MAKKKSRIELHSLDPSVTAEDLLKAEEEGDDYGSPLIKSIVNSLSRAGTTITRLSFEEDPHSSSQYGGLWYQKLVMVPDSLLKRITQTDDLVAAITLARRKPIKSLWHSIRK